MLAVNDSMEDTQKWERKLHCSAAAHKSVSQKPMAKKKKHFSTTNRNIA